MIVRIVLDTNVVISGLLWRRATYRLIVAIRSDSSVRLLSSGPLITELSDVLQRPGCAKQLHLIGKNNHAIVADYLDAVELVEPASISRTLLDSSDDTVLATALAANADLIVSGDSDLLNLKSFHRIPIVTPSEALARIEKQRDEK